MHKLCFCFTNDKLFLRVDEIKLEFKVWREQVGHAGDSRDRRRESVNSVVHLPFHLLTFVLPRGHINVTIIQVDRALRLAENIPPHVYHGRLIIDDLHELLRVFTKI